MQKTITIIIVLIVIIAGIYLVTSNNKSSVTSPIDNSQTSPVSVSNTSTPSDVTVSIKNFAFNPATLKIKTGTKVIWVNDDTAPHTVTSDSGNLLNSPTLSQGESFSFTFTSAGSINYHCAIHPMMKGSIIIEN